MNETKKNKIYIYDTTLRDGSQGEGVSFNGEDKVRVAQKLDDLGVDFIEGGWPGSNPKDAYFFEKMKNVSLNNAKMAAFGSTARKGVLPEKDNNLNMLLESEAPVITIFGKSWDFHVKEVLKTTLEDNLNIIEKSIAYLKSHGHEVVYDAEHFFDGAIANEEYAYKTLEAAINGGADWLVLCDTNGGRMPWDVKDHVEMVLKKFDKPVGVHCHNDSELAVANTLMAVEAGATQVQGTINGYGERCGNANLCSLIPSLEIKGHYPCLKGENLSKLVETSYYIDQLANMVPNDRAAYIGRSAFAHKGGMHVNAVKKNVKTFEHIDPEIIGNKRRILISELSGKSNLVLKAQMFGFENVDEKSDKILAIVEEVKNLENQGYSFEGADASLQVLMSRFFGTAKSFFEVNSFSVFVNSKDQQEISTQATVDIDVFNKNEQVMANGEGPIHALDSALRKALLPYYSSLKLVYLTDYKVRVFNAKEATQAKVRVLIKSCDGSRSWSTVGVSSNIVEASWIALLDSVTYCLQTPMASASEVKEN
ncbi:citramalate synthase [PVC group bacterium (ex Bugula neritina AB1)]|nr:citramalate synthase [PVC group bacterium (ex Bugula neritina AB1)]